MKSIPFLDLIFAGFSWLQQCRDKQHYRFDVVFTQSPRISASLLCGYQLSCTTSAGATHPHSLVPLRHKSWSRAGLGQLAPFPEASHHKTPLRVLQAAQRYLSSTKRDPDVASILQLNRRLSLHHGTSTCVDSHCPSWDLCFV